MRNNRLVKISRDYKPESKRVAGCLRKWEIVYDAQIFGSPILMNLRLLFYGILFVIINFILRIRPVS